jgi:serine/threonine-protein kinase SRPK3
MQADFSGACKELQIFELLSKQQLDHPGKNHIATLIHHFSFTGPNGSHLCLVSTVSGPSMRELARWGKRLPGRDARKAAHQITQAVAYLHGLGICHGGNR